MIDSSRSKTRPLRRLPAHHSEFPTLSESGFFPNPFGQSLAERAFDSSALSLQNIDIARKANVP